MRKRAMGNIFSTISKMAGSNISVGRKGMSSLGISGMVAPGTRRAKIMGPTASTRTANLVTGKGSGRRFISNETFEAAHTVRGKKMVGYGGIGVAAASMGTDRSKGAYNPVRPMTSTPRGTGRFA